MDPTFAAMLFNEVAASGYPCGQFGLAELMISGNGVQKDVPRAMELYESAASQEHPAAMFRLASMMMEEGPMQDLERARRYFIRCAELGMTMAFIVAGDIYFYGMCGDPDMEAAFTWYEQAALAEDPLAMFKCGYMLENGVGASKDGSRSIEMFRGAALRGVPEAQFKMASLAYEGMIPGGKSEAVRWYEKCSESGYPAAKFNLATIYYDGDGVTQDFERAFELYREVACETDDGDAYFMLGRMYLEGLGTARNVEEGFNVIGKAAAAGNAAAQEIIEDMRRRQNMQIINIDGTD